MLETVSSIKLAKEINEKLRQISRADRLNVMIQVNTSGEHGKYAYLLIVWCLFVAVMMFAGADMLYKDCVLVIHYLL